MTLGTAAVLLVLAIAGMIACHSLKGKKALRRVLVVLLALISLALIGYIALTLLFVSAVSGQPPV